MRSRTTRASSTSSPTGATASRPELFGRSGAVAVMALFAVPLAVLARGAAGAAFVLGGFLAVLVADARPDALHALRRRRLDLAGAARRRLRAVPVRDRRRAPPCSRGCSASARCPSGSGRASRSSSPTRATSATRSARAVRRRDLGRALRRRRRAGRRGFLPRRLTRARPHRARSPPPPPRSRSCRSRCTASRTGTRRPTAARGLTPGLVRALRDRRPGEGGRLLGRHDELRDRRIRPRLRRQRPAGSRRRHEGEPAVRAARGRRQFFRTGDLAIPRRYGADVARRRPEPLEAPSRPAAGVLATARYVLYRLNS